MNIGKLIETSVRKLMTPVLGASAIRVKFGPAKGYKCAGALIYTNIFKKPDREDMFYYKQDLKGKTVYDLGGFIGARCVDFAVQVGAYGQVYTFEPHPVFFKLVQKNIKINHLKQASVFNVGVGDKNEKLELISSNASSSTSSFKKINQEGLRKTGTLSGQLAEIIALDDFISKLSLKAPDFIKIDVEGFEYNAIKGMSKTLHKHKPVLVIEMHGTADTKAIVTTLRNGFGYCIQHIEKDKEISDNSSDAHHGHLFCSFIK